MNNKAQISFFKNGQMYIFPCRVVGETKKRYWIEVDQSTPIPSRVMFPGEKQLIPKYAVRIL